jgi:hypothetical protein
MRTSKQTTQRTADRVIDHLSKNIWLRQVYNVMRGPEQVCYKIVHQIRDERREDI